MYNNDMRLKREAALAKVHKALEENNGHTLLSTGITGDDARVAKAVVDAGVRMLEPNHPALALARGHKGVDNMNDAEKVRYEITIDQMAEVVHGVRQVVGDEIYITVGVAGGFTEVMPIELTDEDFIKLSLAGADGLHTHKSSLEDLKVIVDKAHKYGLAVDAYIGMSTDAHQFGITADTPEEVAKVAKEMEDMGVDMIGLMTGMSYGGAAAGEIPEEIKERLDAMVGAVSVPTLAEGGINADNFKAFQNTGVNIIVVGTALDDMVKATAQDLVKTFLA